MSKIVLARSYLDKDCQLVAVFNKSRDDIIGHAFFKVFHSDTLNRDATWITPLVVKAEYRSSECSV